MALILPNDAEPLAFLEFMTTAFRTVVILPISGTFHGKLAELDGILNMLMVGDYTILLGDESKLTDTSAEFAILTALDGDAKTVKELLA